MQRRQSNPTPSLEDHFTQPAQRLREEALRVKTPQKREELLRKARQAEIAARINEWVSSPGLQGPS